MNVCFNNIPVEYTAKLARNSSRNKETMRIWFIKKRYILLLNTEHEYLQITTTLFELDKAYNLHCPFRSYWKLRAEKMCNEYDRYHCLYDANKMQNVEGCRDKPQFDAPGMSIFYFLT